MKALNKHELAYIEQASGLPVSCEPYADTLAPHYLSQQYSFCKLKVGSREVLGIVVEDSSSFRPATFEKQLSKILHTVGLTDGYCLIARGLPAYVRQRLVERGISFVVPHYQLHWPELGLAVKRRQANTQLSSVEHLSPATQAVIIGGLISIIQSPITAKGLSKLLGYTPMTLSRALNEILTCGLGEVVKTGRERLLVFPESLVELWEKSLPYMRSPVRDTVRIQRSDLPKALQLEAGETALASRGMLVAPREPCYAIGKTEWKALAINEFIPVEDEGTCLVQLWRYNPALFADNHGVDAFSLFLSLNNEHDERVQQALEALVKTIL